MDFTTIMRRILPKIRTNGIDYESYVNGGSTGYAPELSNPDRSDYNDTTLPYRESDIQGGQKGSALENCHFGNCKPGVRKRFVSVV